MRWSMSYFSTSARSCVLCAVFKKPKLGSFRSSLWPSAHIARRHRDLRALLSLLFFAHYSSSRTTERRITRILMIPLVICGIRAWIATRKVARTARATLAGPRAAKRC
ncbi:unnamed protein product [Leptosia nina]|uniref:Secreted protein n=1 Tax=Leptosia nina TaxID=320188 RepID=A0AAV1JX88_9NEOP